MLLLRARLRPVRASMWLDGLVSDLTLAALAELRRCAGSQFDPSVVDAFCAANPVRLEPATLASA